MNKTLKKAISIILTILMVVTSVPLAFAADGHTHALSADGETVEFTELPADTTRIDTAGSYYLTQDIELTDELSINVEGTVNLCLNGHSITAVEDSSNQTVVFLYGGTLNLCDCKGGGCITSAEDLTFSGVRTLSDTEFNMYSGEIKNNYYYAVQGGNFNMYGGKLSRNKKTAVYVTDTFNMYGGEISGNSKSAIEGVAVEVYAGNFNMYGGEIKNNENISSYINASIVGVNGGATFTMYDGKICDNEGPAVYSGGTFIMNGGEISGNSGYSSGVSVGTGGIFTMNGGAIKNNTASGRGGGVYINERASFNMNGGEISGNTAEQGGGVFSTYDSAKINLKKGVITGNTATYAGGVGAQYANTPVEISGADVQIVNNTASTYPDLRVNSPLIVSAPLDSAKTKISLSVNGEIIAKPDGTNLTTLEGMEDCFVMSDEELFVMCNENGELVAIKWSATIAEKDGDLVVTATDNGKVTYQWYEVNGDELTELEGETSSTLAGEKLVVDKTYACRIYLAGEEIETLAIKYPYAITHQPTAGEPYVELNDDTDATYQWYAVEVDAEEITDENADTVAYDWGESSYSEETGWTGVPYEEDYNGQDFFTVELEAGETITVEITGDIIDGVGLWDYDTENGAWVDSEEDVTSYELTVESEGNYTFYTYVNSGVVTVKAYKTAVEKTAIEGETSAELKNPEVGKKYVCEATYGNGETEMSDAFEYTYAITHQPTEAEPYVELNDDTDASYQWHTAEAGSAEITDENASGDWQSMGAPFDNTVYEDGKWIADDSVDMQYYFMVELEAGDTVNLEFASEVEFIVFAINGDISDYIEVGGTECSVTVEESGTYWLITPPVDYVCADIGNIAYNAIEGETAAVLNPTALGRYACEVTFADGTTEMSDTFEVTKLHTCDFSGEWKYDADKHWKECECGLTSEEGTHTGGTATCTDKAVCDLCGASYGELAEHTAEPTFTDNGNGTHSAVYPCCGTTVTEEHDFENDAHQCVCGKMETFTVSWFLSGSLMQSTSTYGQEFTQTFTVPENTHLRIDSVYLTNDASVPVNYTYENGVLTIAATDVPAADVYIDCDHNVLVTFHANGGEIIPEDGYPQEGSTDIFPEDGSYWTREWNYGLEICLSNCAAVCREGYTFVDWRDASGQVHQVIPGNGNYTLATEDMTFYAQWQCNHTIGGVVFRDNGNGTHNGYCGECDELLGNYVEHPHNFGDNTYKCVCGYACPHDSYTDGVCDNCDYECPHEWGEGVLTRPVYDAVLGSKDGYYTYTCTLCGEEKTETVKSADYSDYEAVSDEINALLQSEELTDAAKQAIYSAANECGLPSNDLTESEQNKVDDLVAELEKIVADAEEKIANGEYVKADYTEIDEAIDDIEEKLASENVTDEGKAELEEIKKQLEEMKADENTSEADLAELEKELEAYEEELDKGIEDGTLVEVDVDAIADDVNKKWAEKLEAEGLLDEYEDFINNQKATDEAMAAVDEINDFANSLEGTVAENAENIAKLNEMLDSLYSSFENCLRGTHNFNNYEVTSPAKCEINAKETGTCWFCGETDEREIEGTALKHSFTKYEVAEEAKCGVAGKEVAYCDNGCQTTDERETPALEHIFLDYISNGDATCTADGTKTAECIRGCGKTDTVTDEGSMIDHADKDGNKICDDCEAEIVDICTICGRPVHEDEGIPQYICLIIAIFNIIVSLIKAIS